MRSLSATAAIVAFLAGVTFGSTSAQRGAPPPARDTPAASPQTGTALIGGTVLSDEATPVPLRRATVTLRNMELTGLPSIASSRISVTDDAGRFGFANLPAGRFSLSISKPAYVSTSYGARELRGQGLTIVVADGQRTANLVVKMAKGAVITGRVVDDSGRPAAGLRVGVAEQVIVNGERTYRTSFGLGSEVDDRGVYRIFGLAPATYIVGTSGSPAIGMAGGGPRVTTAAEIQWARRGNPAASAQQQAPPPRGPGARPATVFYPGTTDSNSATAITLAAGEERTGVDFTVQIVPTTTLEGTVRRPDGQPVRNVQVLPVLSTNSVQVGFPLFPPRATVTPQGRFSVSGLVPGHYLVTARASSGEVLGPAPRGRGAGAPIADLWATAEIDVAGQDITDLALTLMPGMSIAGRIVFEGTTPPPPDLTTTRVNMNAPPNSGVALGVPAAEPAADGSFTFPAVAPGDYLMSAFLTGGSPFSPTWVLKSVVAEGRDVLDTPFEVRPGMNTSGVVVTFTDKVTQLTGTLTDQVGRPAPSYFVIVYSTNTKEWRQQSRWLRPPTRPASDGKFTIAGLPPGEYYLAALSEFNQQEWYTPPFLQQLVPMSLKFTLAEGEKKVQDLKLAGQ